MPKRILVVPYDPAWRSAFEAEAVLISRMLGTRVSRLHHIGSTAIPEIFAKPVIDMLLEVENILELDAMTPAMKDIGYEAMGELGIPNRRYFRKNNALGVRAYHVHAFEIRSPEAKRHLAFRDYMVAHPVEAGAYSDLKRNLALLFPEDIEEYMNGKNPFIKEHEANALAWQESRKDGRIDHRDFLGH